LLGVINDLFFPSPSSNKEMTFTPVHLENKKYILGKESLGRPEFWMAGFAGGELVRWCGVRLKE
jgi:hypothetical protein